MKYQLLLLGLVVGLVAAQLAEECTETCQLPNCRCSSPLIPGNLRPRDVPQFVTIGFTGAINVVNIETFRSILYNRVNPNSCPIGATFFINHQYTNYQLVNELYLRNYEIGLHSISSRFPNEFWATATYQQLTQELAEQRIQIAHFANIPMDSIQGMKMPFLQMSGNTNFQVMRDNNILYDFTWTTVSATNPPLWPYTLDYASTQDCPVQPCPTASIPGVWVQPLISWIDLQGFPCATLDACMFVPDRVTDAEGWYMFMLRNFERHYLSNRAPFPLHVNEGYISAWPAVNAAYIRFLNMINSLPDVFVVTGGEVLNWVRNPVPIDQYRQQPCRSFITTSCIARNCGNYILNDVQYNLQICNVCPRVFPWVGNPLGV